MGELGQGPETQPALCFPQAMHLGMSLAACPEKGVLCLMHKGTI